MSIFPRPNAPPKSWLRRHSGIVANPWPMAEVVEAPEKPRRDWTNVRLVLILAGVLTWGIAVAVLFGLGGQ